MKVLLLGYYGYNNFGDDLMLYSLLNELIKYDNLKINVFCKNELKCFPKNDKINYCLFYNNSKFKNLLNFIKVAIKSKYVFWGGGTCFTDQDGVSIRYFLLAKLLNCKIGYLGIGIGKVSGFNKIKMLFILSLSKVITVRDESSFKILNSYYFLKNKIKKTNDLVFLYNFEFHSTLNKMNYLLVSLHNLKNYADDKTIEKRREYLITYIMNKHLNKKVIILPLSDVDYEENFKFYTLAKRKINNIEFIDEKCFKEKLIYIKNASIFYTERLHGYILSKIFNIDSIPLNYSQKFIFFQNEVNIYYEGINLNNLEKLKTYEVIDNNVIRPNIISILKEQASINTIIIKDELLPKSN